jgi:hypothetical protein
MLFLMFVEIFTASHPGSYQIDRTLMPFSEPPLEL